MYAALIQAYAMNKMQNEAIEMLNSLHNGSFGDGIKPALPSFTAGIFAAIQKQDWKQVLRIHDMMIESSVKPSCTTLQCVLLAHMQEGETERSLKTIEQAIDSNMVIDKDTFTMCTKNILPDNNGDGDINF